MTTTHERASPPGPYNGDKTVCSAGHPLSGDNLFRDNTGRRRCRACSRARSQVQNARRAQAKRAAAASPARAIDPHPGA